MKSNELNNLSHAHGHPSMRYTHCYGHCAQFWFNAKYIFAYLLFAIDLTSTMYPPYIESELMSTRAFVYLRLCIHDKFNYAHSQAGSKH